MRVCKWDCDGGGEGWSGRRKKPLTEKSTNVSTKEERRLGMSLQNDVFEGLEEFDAGADVSATMVETLVLNFD